MTSDELEIVLFECVKSFVGEQMPIGGKIYYMGSRPIQANATDYQEDAVVGFLTGRGADVIEGTCLVNVYVSDTLTPSGQYYKSKIRCVEVAQLLMQFPSYANKAQGQVFFDRREVIATLAEESIKQHFVSLKMDFKVLNQYY